MLASSTIGGHSSTAAKSIKKQQSESFNGVRRRTPTNGSPNARPTSEFGWQMALQGLPLASKEPLIEEELDKDKETGAKVRDGAANWQPHPSQQGPPCRSSPSNKTRNQESSAESSASDTNIHLAELSQRYAKKDIGWQVGLQGQHIPPSQEERSSLLDEDTNPYSGADIGSRESPQLKSKALPSLAKLDTFKQLNLEEAAKIYRGFSTAESSSALKLPPRSSSYTPTPTRTPKKDFLNNPFHAIRLQEQASKLSNNLIDLDDDRPFPPAPQYPPLPPKSRPVQSSKEVRADLLDCEYCPKKLVVTEVSQISECLHVICHSCLANHVGTQLSDSHFPVKCPLCFLLEETAKPGIITMEILEQLNLPRDTVDIFLDLEISARSSSVFCPKCETTMRVERTQYLEQTVIKCPVGHCGHLWCKFCLKEMPRFGSTQHKCKPSKKTGVRSCPGCGYQSRKTAEDNYMQCHGVGCKLHFCFKCGGRIADGKTDSDISAAVASHYNSCTRHSKADKCKVQ